MTQSVHVMRSLPAHPDAPSSRVAHRWAVLQMRQKAHAALKTSSDRRKPGSLKK